MSRRVCIIGAAVLLAVEFMIGAFADGWVRAYLGDVLIMPLMYALWRSVSPVRPRPGWVLPTVLLAFAFAVEFIQLLGAASMIDGGDAFGLFLRTIIGTSFSVIDLLCYAVGTAPLYIAELLYVKKQ